MSIEGVLSGAEKWCVEQGNSEEVLARLPASSVHAVITDPPAGISFMGLEFDHHKGGRAAWCAWLAGILAHARAATVPGGRAFVWSLPRTSHWTGCAVEDAGWSIETTVQHLFGTGWPKGKSQLKPAAETWWLARTGPSLPLNVDACRVASTGERLGGGAEKRDPNNGTGWDRPWRADEAASEAAAQRTREAVEHASRAGRYPPNAVFSHGPGCVREGERRVRGITGGTKAIAADRARVYGEHTEHPFFNHADPDGTEAVEAWRCEPGCVVAALDAQAGERTSGVKGGGLSADGTACYDETGGASRFFPQFEADDLAEVFRYIAKPSRAEKNAGCDATGRVRLRRDLTPDQRRFVLAELERRGVRP